MCLYSYTCILTCMSVWLYMYSYTCTCMSVWLCIHIYSYTCTCTYTCMSAWLYCIVIHDNTWDGKKERKKERKKDRHLRQWKNENELPQVGFEPMTHVHVCVYLYDFTSLHTRVYSYTCTCMSVILSDFTCIFRTCTCILIMWLSCAAGLNTQDTPLTVLLWEENSQQMYQLNVSHHKS